MLRISIDKEKCISCGGCTIVAGEIFRIDDKNNKAGIIDGELVLDYADLELSDEQYETIKQAKESCPGEAIVIKNR